jgi:membrane protein implicated in regulation of membrane protease activity
MTIAFIDQISQWWDQMNMARQVFYGIGLVAAFMALVLAVLGFLGMEHHDAIDATSADLDHGGGGIFSVKPLTGFFLGFGWAGGMALEAGWPLMGALAAAVLAGAAIMALIVVMFRTIVAMRSDGTVRIEDAVGAVGTVYVSLPPSKAAGGQVTVNFKGRQETFAALNATAQPVPSGEKIKVVAIIDGRTVLVEPLA